MKKKDGPPEKLNTANLKIFRSEGEDVPDVSDARGNIKPPAPDMLAARVTYLKREILGEANMKKLLALAWECLNKSDTKVRNIEGAAARLVDYLLAKRAQNDAWWAGIRSEDSRDLCRWIETDLKRSPETLLSAMAAAQSAQKNFLS